MSEIFTEISEIKHSLLQMSSYVEDVVKKSIIAFKQNNIELASKIIDTDKIIDDFENHIDQLILNTIATLSPKDKDLHFLLSAKHISEQLERVADHAVNISEQIIYLSKTDSIGLISPGNIDMASIAIKMLTESINAFVFNDTNLALKIREEDIKVDLLYNNVLREEIKLMENNKEDIKSGVYNIILALNLERIADLATNIAEQVIFFVEGRSIKHLSNEDFLANKHTIFHQSTDPYELINLYLKLIHSILIKINNILDLYFQKQIDKISDIKKEINDDKSQIDLIKRKLKHSFLDSYYINFSRSELNFFLLELEHLINFIEDTINWLSYKLINVDPVLKDLILTLHYKSISISANFQNIIQKVIDSKYSDIKTIYNDLKKYYSIINELEDDIKNHESQIKEHIFRETKDTFLIYFLIRLVELIKKVISQLIKISNIYKSIILK